MAGIVGIRRLILLPSVPDTKPCHRIWTNVGVALRQTDSSSLRVIAVSLDGWGRDRAGGAWEKNAKWALGGGLRLVGSECRHGRWTVSAVGQGSARCPGCDAQSTRRHGWRVRHLQDLPAQGTPVTLRGFIFNLGARLAPAMAACEHEANQSLRGHTWHGANAIENAWKGGYRPPRRSHGLVIRAMSVGPDRRMAYGVWPAWKETI